MLDQPLFEKFFKLYYSKLNSLDAKGIVRLLTADGRTHGNIDLQFREAASLFKLVDDSNYVSVAVPWGDKGRALVDTLTSGFDRFSGVALTSNLAVIFTLNQYTTTCGSL